MPTPPSLSTQQNATAPSLGLFDTAEDPMGFGLGEHFDAKRVTSLLKLKKADISKISSVSVSSVRYDDAMPAAVRERIEEIASTVNLVAQQFGGDPHKTIVWFKAKNPLLGDVSPRDMIRLGRYLRLRRFIISAMTSHSSISTAKAVSKAEDRA